MAACTLRLTPTYGVSIAGACLSGRRLEDCPTGTTGIEPVADKLLYLRPGHEAVRGRT